MPKIKSAIKRMEISQRNTIRNTAIKSSVKTAVKKCEQALEDNKSETTRTVLVDTIRTIDTAVSQGVIHKNNAARKKSRLQRKFNAIQD